MNGPTINGEQYELIVLRVIERDPYGRPFRTDVIYDEQTVSLIDGKPNDFITVFAKKSVVEMKPGGHA